MTYHDTDNENTSLKMKPLFASAWMALFDQLRRNYNDRHAADRAGRASLKSMDKDQREQKFN